MGEEMPFEEPSPLDEIQPEPAPAEPAAVEKGKELKAKKEKPAKSGFSTLVEKAAYALLFLLLGALAVTLAVYLPAASKLKTAQTELDRLIPVETQYYQLQEEYGQVETLGILNKLMGNTALAQQAFETGDANRGGQYLLYIEEDLKELEIPAYPDMPASLMKQFEKAKTLAASSTAADRTKAADELQKFYNDLLTLANNIQ